MSDIVDRVKSSQVQRLVCRLRDPVPLSVTVSMRASHELTIVMMAISGH